MDLLTDLEFRGQIYQNTDSEDSPNAWPKGRLPPTADSILRLTA